MAWWPEVEVSLDLYRHRRAPADRVHLRMWVDDRHMSTSLTTIVLEPGAEETRLTYTEQGVHFDGLDTVEGREAGTRGLLDNLGAFLTRAH